MIPCFVWSVSTIMMCMLETKCLTIILSILIYMIPVIITYSLLYIICNRSIVTKCLSVVFWLFSYSWLWTRTFKFVRWTCLKTFESLIFDMTTQSFNTLFEFMGMTGCICIACYCACFQSNAQSHVKWLNLWTIWWLHYTKISKL